MNIDPEALDGRLPVAAEGDGGHLDALGLQPLGDVALHVDLHHGVAPARAAPRRRLPRSAG
jgi:hypothetical protein